MYIHTHTCMYIYIHIVHKCTYPPLGLCLLIHTHKYLLPSYSSVYMNVCRYVFLHVYMYTYTHHAGIHCRPLFDSHPKYICIYIYTPIRLHPCTLSTFLHKSPFHLYSVYTHILSTLTFLPSFLHLSNTILHQYSLNPSTL